jgi:mRNA interferase RelE/StbE
MNTTFKTSFFRDAKKISAELRPELDKVIIAIENAKSLNQIPDLKKLKGHITAYRIKVGAYRLCFHFENQTINITRFLPRKDVYRYFP